MRIITITAFLALVGALSLSGCVYASITTTLDNDVHETTLGEKVGRSFNQSVLGLVAWGDGGSAAAARDGGIEVLRHMDQEILNILGFVYVRRTVVVYGD